MKKLLVIMPLYNREKYVKDAIESVLGQTHTNFELVIIDDCSTDNSLNIALKYKHKSNVTILTNNENKGCYYSRNKGLQYFKNAEWDYFTIHDSDDVSDVNRFKEILSEFNENTLGVRTLCLQVDENLKPMYENKQLSYIYGEGVSFFKRAVFDTILGFYDNTRFGGDSDYWLRLEEYCNVNPLNSVILSNKPLYFRRNHSAQLTKKYDWNTHRQHYAKRFKNDILQMSKIADFYREKFD